MPILRVRTCRVDLRPSRAAAPLGPHRTQSIADCRSARGHGAYSGNFPESCPAPVAIRPPEHGNPGWALQSIQKGGSAALIATGARLCPALASRETPDAFGVALHHRHRNAKIVSRRHKVVVERCHFNRITQCMSGASLDEFVVPEHPSHDPAKDLSAQGGIPEEWLRFR